MGANPPPHYPDTKGMTMRTTITSAMTGKAVTFDGNVQGWVGIRLSDGQGVILERDELLDALREALGVTITDEVRS